MKAGVPPAQSQERATCPAFPGFLCTSVTSSLIAKEKLPVKRSCLFRSIRATCLSVNSPHVATQAPRTAAKSWPAKGSEQPGQGLVPRAVSSWAEASSRLWLLRPTLPGGLCLGTPPSRVAETSSGCAWVQGQQTRGPACTPGFCVMGKSQVQAFALSSLRKLAAREHLLLPKSHPEKLGKRQVWSLAHGRQTSRPMGGKPFSAESWRGPAGLDPALWPASALATARLPPFLGWRRGLVHHLQHLGHPRASRKVTQRRTEGTGIRVGGLQGPRAG